MLSDIGFSLLSSDSAYDFVAFSLNLCRSCINCLCITVTIIINFQSYRKYKIKMENMEIYIYVYLGWGQLFEIYAAKCMQW